MSGPLRGIFLTHTVENNRERREEGLVTDQALLTVVLRPRTKQTTTMNASSSMVPMAAPTPT